MRCFKTQVRRASPIIRQMIHLEGEPIKKGHGIYQNGGPPIVGTVGGQSGQIRLTISQTTTRKELQALVLQHTLTLSCANTDGWKGYSHLSNLQRVHKTVHHGDKQWAKDEDGDGINEVHTNTIEDMWTGLRNQLRTFRGVCKWYLYTYYVIHEWRINTNSITPVFCQAMCFHYNDLPL